MKRSSVTMKPVLSLFFCLCLALGSSFLFPVAKSSQQTKPSTLEEQLAKLAELGLKLDKGISIDDLLYSAKRKEYEEQPFDLILFVFGSEVERAPWGRPFCSRVWNFDPECITATGDYVSIVKRLCQVAGRPGCLKQVRDFVNIRAGKAWLRYKVDGTQRNLRMEVNDDWADVETLMRVMADIERDGHRFYFVDNGQSMILFYLDAEKAAELNRLSNDAFEPVRPIEQALSSVDDEYEVLSVLIDEMYLTGEYKKIVITNPTCCDVSDGGFPSALWMKRYGEELNPISLETLDDYAARNKQSLTLERRFKIKGNYHIVPYAQIEKHFHNVELDGAWKKFYDKYPGSNGFVRLSRVGFNKAKDQAIVNTAWMRGPLYGEGHYVLLAKQNGSWKVLKRVGTWVA